MKKNRTLFFVADMIALMIFSIGCLVIDIPMQIIDRVVGTNEEEVAVPQASTVNFAPTSTTIIEPIATVTTAPSAPTAPAKPTATEISPMDYEDTFMFRGNLLHSGVYQSPGPKLNPEPVWIFEGEEKIVSSPAIVDGILYLGSGSGINALDANNGKLLWTYVTEGRVDSSPAVVDGVVYFGGEDGQFYALDARDGAMIWTFSTGDRISSSPAIFDGKVYFGSYDSFFYALKADTGMEVWKFEIAGLVDLDTGIRKVVNSSPVIFKEIVIIGSGQIGGASAELFLYGLDAQTGEKLWEYPVWSNVSTPMVSNGVVYFGDFGNLNGLDASSGNLVFEYHTGIITTSPVIDNGVAYFGTEEGLLFAVDLASAEEKWIFNSGDYISSDPSVADGVVYFGCNDGFMRAVDAISGKELWKFDSSARITTSPVISAGVIYYGNDNLFALK